MNLKKGLFFLFLFACMLAKGNDFSQQDKEIFEQYIKSVRNTPKDKLFTETALYFIDSPYKAGTLEGNRTEQLVVNLREFDCTTLVETCMALYLTIKNGSPDYESFRQNLQNIRYRHGTPDGYASRLHYITDWIAANENKGFISDRTKQAGGVPLRVNVNYMSTHPQSYPAMKRDPREIAKMEIIESHINSRENTHFYIPKEDIDKNQQKIRTGDIIFFTTSVKGLDVSHAGIAYRNNKQLTFIHASSRHEKVMINPESLADYCRNSKSITGIMVMRVK